MPARSSGCSSPTASPSARLPPRRPGPSGPRAASCTCRTRSTRCAATWPNRRSTNSPRAGLLDAVEVLNAKTSLRSLNERGAPFRRRVRPGPRRRQRRSCAARARRCLCGDARLRRPDRLPGQVAPGPRGRAPLGRASSLVGREYSRACPPSRTAPRAHHPRHRARPRPGPRRVPAHLVERTSPAGAVGVRLERLRQRVHREGVRRGAPPRHADRRRRLLPARNWSSTCARACAWW